MAKKHIYRRDEMVRSVLLSEEVSALCGLSKVVTREDVDSVVGSSRKPCKACLEGVASAAQERDVTLHQAKGWTDALEQEWKRLHAERRSITGRYTFKLGDVQGWEFPLAG